MSYYHTKTRVAPTTRVIDSRHTEYATSYVYIYIYIYKYIYNIRIYNMYECLFMHGYTKLRGMHTYAMTCIIANKVDASYGMGLYISNDGAR